MISPFEIDGNAIWTIPASSGRESILCKKLSDLEGELILCSAGISGDFWGRKPSPEQSQLVRPRNFERRW